VAALLLLLIPWTVLALWAILALADPACGGPACDQIRANSQVMRWSFVGVWAVGVLVDFFLIWRVIRRR
jgi:hypothetical protein